jgi:uncharacterized repeat protein (TIGR03803 family)
MKGALGEQKYSSLLLRRIAMIAKLTLPILSALAHASISVLLLVAARPAQAQTETVLYNFTGGADGGEPVSSPVFDSKGNLYGTTLVGGDAFDVSEGTVYELSPNGSGGWNETVLYSFCTPSVHCPDGNYPDSNLIFDGVGNLYGTASSGGAYGHGVVFELSPSKDGGWNETVLCSFAGGMDGSGPGSGLIMDSAGNLYGTTAYGGGQYGNGSVFELSPSKGGGWTEQVIYDYWASELTMDAAGNIFGNGSSFIFELSPNGKGGWNETLIHTFPSSKNDGLSPSGTLLLDKEGRLYGTTGGGGATGNGTVYRLSPGKKGKWTETILYSFKGGAKDGSSPGGIVFDTAGNIYGTSLVGGSDDNNGVGFGTVFELEAPLGRGNYKEKVLWSFGFTDGDYPYAAPILDNLGNLYGTTKGGGSGNYYGVVFEVSP